jgi:hypothetical protein
MGVQLPPLAPSFLAGRTVEAEVAHVGALTPKVWREEIESTISVVVTMAVA